MTCQGECGVEIAVESAPLVIEASAPFYADPFVVLFCALFACVCGTYVAAKLAGANVDEGDEP